MSFDEESRTLSFYKQRYELDKDKISEPQMSRREYLDFVWWLKCNVTEADFPEDMRIRRTMFNKYTYDYNAKPRCFINTILTEDNEYLYKGLSLLMMRYHGYCVVSKRDRDNLFEIPVYYEEDLYNVIRLHGVSEDKAKEYAVLLFWQAKKQGRLDNLNRIVK